MSTPFYDLASLVLVPSGTKAQKIYAQKPLTTDGQLAFTRSTTATRVNSAGLIEASAVNVPRLDYLGSTCPRLLLEPQRTNLVTYSEQLDNAAWTKQNGSVTANTTVSPDGYTNADTFTSDSTTGEHNVYNASPITLTSDAFTLSCYVKAITGRYFALSNYQAGQNYSAYATFDLQTGTTVATGAIFGTYISNSIQSVGNGWYRVSVTGSGVTSNFIGINAMTAANFNPSVNTVGQGQSYAIYGVQIEQGAYATSYIPTTTAAVTRLADACSKTGISSLIGQTEGTLFSDFVVNGLQNFGTPISVNDGTTGNYVWLTIFGNGTLRAEVFNSSGVQATISYSSAVVGGRYKMAFAYKANDFVLYVNGALIGTSNSGSTFSGSTLSRVDFDITTPASFSVASESINQALIFKTRLSNADLAALTA